MDNAEILDRIKELSRRRAIVHFTDVASVRLALPGLTDFELIKALQQLAEHGQIYFAVGRQWWLSDGRSSMIKRQVCERYGSFTRGKRVMQRLIRRGWNPRDQYVFATEK